MNLSVKLYACAYIHTECYSLQYIFQTYVSDHRCERTNITDKLKYLGLLNYT